MWKGTGQTKEVYLKFGLAPVAWPNCLAGISLLHTVPNNTSFQKVCVFLKRAVLPKAMRLGVAADTNMPNEDLGCLDSCVGRAPGFLLAN